ncbi:LysE family transporter [Helicobacter saguini]|uniref:Amino acid transporter n=1 Tax=Helicobacter saguini TaxID=1548018 RepID=A0A347VR58_9HELI|nr:LysE family transporter [Helicobacter saguini]MWV63025.1 LysE family transporter [Helicobacter saguini]MWV66306.1 LysE family transporter [Helicobacter saguini]MWV68658.1 LysE family transporter [Helicobacter saguini]MWV71791.1 LysE family transporter [Helicobacter saguini]TLD95819.1 amino acid transporter [Helicobacter saguini]
MFAFFKGFLLTISLTASIGAQNLLLLKQCLLGKYVFFTALIFFLSDCILISLGVFGIGEIFSKSKILSLIIAFCGIIFCLYYAILSFISFIKNENIQDNKKAKTTLIKTLLFALAVTFLNPQVYLDTIFVIGAASLSLDSKILFLCGALSASFAWFFSIALFAKALNKYLLNKKFSKFMDIFSIIIMLCVVYSLIVFVVKNL